MGWKIDDVVQKPHTGSAGYIGLLTPTKQGAYGSIKVEGWVWGCAQNALYGFNNVSGVDEEDYTSLKEFLTTLTTSLNNGHYGYKAKRYLFILSSHQVAAANSFLNALIADSKLLDTYENLSHGGAMQHLYRLDL